MPPKHRTNRSDLFLVRFWLDDTGGSPQGRAGWGGKVQRAVTGESREFSDWAALVSTLRAMLAATSPPFMVDDLPESEAGHTSGSSNKGEQR